MIQPNTTNPKPPTPTPTPSQPGSDETSKNGKQLHGDEGGAGVTKPVIAKPGSSVKGRSMLD